MFADVSFCFKLKKKNFNCDHNMSVWLLGVCFFFFKENIFKLLIENS